MVRHRTKLSYPFPEYGYVQKHLRAPANFWQTYTYDSPNLYSEEMYDFVNGPKGQFNNVTHTRLKDRIEGRFRKKPPTSPNQPDQYVYENYGHTQLFDEHAARAALAVDELDFTQLDFQANNAFNLGELLSDLDDGIVKFVTGLFKPNYGNFRWGILPFISDLKSLIATIGDLTSKIAKELSMPVGLESSLQYDLVDWDSAMLNFDMQNSMLGYHKIEGLREVCTPFFGAANALQILLDEIGVHPDVRLVWDIIPLSFVVDYFIPIGDILEAAHPRGWYKPVVQFSGHVSYKMECEVRPHRDRWIFTNGVSPASTGTIYRRFYVENLKGYRAPIKVPKWEFPSALQLFNTAYLAFTSRGAKSHPMGKIKIVKWLQNH